MLYLTLISSLIAAIALDQVCLFQAGDNLLYAIFTFTPFSLNPILAASSRRVRRGLSLSNFNMANSDLLGTLSGSLSGTLSGSLSGTLSGTLLGIYWVLYLALYCLSESDRGSFPFYLYIFLIRSIKRFRI